MKAPSWPPRTLRGTRLLSGSRLRRILPEKARSRAEDAMPGGAYSRRRSREKWLAVIAENRLFFKSHPLLKAWA